MNSKELHHFYDTENGHIVRCLIGRQVIRNWKNISSGDIFLAFGYGLPYLNYFLKKTAYCFDLVPKEMGAASWKCSRGDSRKNKPQITLVNPIRWSFANNAATHLLMIHGMEFFQYPEKCLEEAWRVLNPSGELMLVIPNKYSPWMYIKNGLPGKEIDYSYLQIYQMLEHSGFDVVKTQGAVYFLPCLYKNNPTKEGVFAHIGKKLLNWWPGFWIITAKKKSLQTLPLVKKKYKPSLKLQLKT